MWERGSAWNAEDPLCCVSITPVCCVVNVNGNLKQPNISKTAIDLDPKGISIGTWPSSEKMKLGPSYQAGNHDQQRCLLRAKGTWSGELQK